MLKSIYSPFLNSSVKHALIKALTIKIRDLRKQIAIGSASIRSGVLTTWI